MRTIVFNHALGRITLLVFGIAVACAVIIPSLLMKEERLKGLVVDLELNGPDAGRYGELREALTKRICAEEPALRDVLIQTDYVHFSQFSRELLDTLRPDFLILSPQGTPWHRYRDQAAEELQRFKDVLKDLIVNSDLPVLAVCGGHQLLALTFGGTVGFMDSRYVRDLPERYPKDAIAERGPTMLVTLRGDPILTGVVTHPGTFLVMESHYEEVKSVPEPFVNLARSEMSEVQLMRIPGKLVYGLAFHPERCWNGHTDPRQNAGTRILTNFVTMVAARH
jgi:GMP synthase (glutamine-hydrolysing)